MVKVKKYEDEMGSQIILKFPEDLDLNIMYGGNLDLYFSPVSHADEREHFLLEISKMEDPELYTLFKETWKKVIAYKPSGTKTDKSFKWQDEHSAHPLVKDEMITWFSDNEPIEIAPCVTIYKQDGKMCLFFKGGKNKNGTPTNSIRFCTDGSRYMGFYVPFLELYNQICHTDFGDRELRPDEMMLNLKPRGTQEK